MHVHEITFRVRSWWRRLPRPVVVGLVVAVIAVAGLAWQHAQHQPTPAGHTTVPPASSSAAAAPDDLGDTTVGQLAPPTVTLDEDSAAAARAVASRFAANFGSPNGNRGDWLARISPDVSMQLVEQYRLTDIRNVTQAAVTFVTGPDRRIDSRDQARGVADVGFDVGYDDGSRVQLRMEPAADGWKVVDVLPLTSDGLPAPDGEAVPTPGGQAAPDGAAGGGS